MSTDPTPPSDELPAGSTEGVRAGTKTKFNLPALTIGLLLVITAFVVIYLASAGGFSRANSGVTVAPPASADFDTPLAPAKGDSPVEGDAVDDINTRKDGPSDPSPATATP